MPLKWYILGPLIALSGGVFGILAAASQELNIGSYFGAFVAAPVIEEAVKPCGVYLLIAKWPQALPSRMYTALLAALAGLAFGAVENILYLHVYVPEHSHDMVLWRWSVCLLLHAGCSFVVGLGINQQLVASVKGDIPFLKGNWKFFIIPSVIHGSYNVAAYLLETRWNWWELG